MLMVEYEFNNGTWGRFRAEIPAKEWIEAKIRKEEAWLIRAGWTFTYRLYAP